MSMTERNKPFPPPGALKARGEALQRKGAKRVRKVIKNARGLISDLFQKEKLSSWLINDHSGRSQIRTGDSLHDGKNSLRRPPTHPQRQQQQEQQQQQLHQQPGGQGQSSTRGKLSNASTKSKADSKGKGTSGPVPQELEHAQDPLDSIGSLSETEALAEEKSTSTTSRQKTALDTLSTIDSDENWDEVERGTDILKTFDDVASTVQPGLFIGAFLAEQNKPELKKKGVTHILQVGDNLSRSYEDVFQYQTISVSDTESANLLLHFKECFEFIDRARNTGGGVLVHCFAGISRSATVCIGYLMWKLNLSLGAAYSLVEGARKCTQPNRGFKKQLEVFENLGGDLTLLEQWCAHHMSFSFKETIVSAREPESSEFDL